MARSFSSTSDYITQGTVAIPTTGALHIKIRLGTTYNGGVERVWFRVRNDSGGTKLFDVSQNTSGRYKIGWKGASDTRSDITAGNFNSNSWNNITCLWTDAGDTKVYIDNFLLATIGSTSTWDTTGTTRYIGIDGVSVTLNSNVPISEIAIWNSASMTADDLLGMSRGVSPGLIMPASLVDYLPIIGQSPEPNRRSGSAGTVTGTGLYAHPRIFLSSIPLQLGVPAGAAPPASVQQRLMLMGVGG